ncbi:hypothetical protein CPK_ORF00995 [Chlamydia pneumoniae LPCoLN]|uniref:Uncharacterized protein n=1 Tax=Chlamydia pneumoniae TaxID=83558 RepID=A0A0F7WYT9_CHLPN|nr:hypothetical protein CPK_ORF00995 [Chlamydia pneumoniae LPCoLN]CRI42593.1 Uncharacterized protein BN1224_DC9_BS_00760 [Chlamydia pneumoniae]
MDLKVKKLLEPQFRILYSFLNHSFQISILKNFREGSRAAQ